MQIKDLIDLQFRLNEKYVFFWNFYIVFVTAALGLIFAQIEHPTSILKGILVLGYFIFVGMNIWGLRNINRLLMASDLEIRRQSLREPDTSQFVNSLCFRNYAQESKWIYIIHFLSGFVVVGLILTSS